MPLKSTAWHQPAAMSFLQKHRKLLSVLRHSCRWQDAPQVQVPNVHRYCLSKLTGPACYYLQTRENEQKISKIMSSSQGLYHSDIT